MMPAPPTSPPPSPPKSNGNPQPQAAGRITFDTHDLDLLPPRIVLNATSGFGKSTTAAYAPDPVFLIPDGDNGYETLLGRKTVPNVPRRVISSWPDLLATLDAIDADPAGRKTVVLDSAGLFEKMLHRLVTDRDFKGEAGEKGFLSFNKGFELSINDWLGMLSKLDRLNRRHGMIVILLTHAEIKTYKNPTGPDFDQYVSDMHKSTWGATRNWADAVLFGNHPHQVAKENQRDKKGKGVGGGERHIYTTHRDAWDAKNRYQMPDAIELGDDYTQNWNTIYHYIKGA